jgi:hypothetical protein
MVNAPQNRRRTSVVRAAAVIALITAFAPGADVVRAQGPHKPSLAGAWLETVVFPPEFGRPPLRSLSTYHENGTMNCSDQGAATLDPPAIYTGCHGVWAQLGKRQFAYTAYELISDLSGNLTGFLKFRGTYTLSDSGNQYTGTTHAEILDVDGNLEAEVDVANSGQRIQLELP